MTETTTPKRKTRIVTMAMLNDAHTEWVRLPLLSALNDMEGEAPTTPEDRRAVREHLEAALKASKAGAEAPEWPEALAPFYGLYVKVRAIRRGAYLLMLPKWPEESKTWPKVDPKADKAVQKSQAEARSRAYEAWFNGLSEEAQAEQRRATAAVTFKVLAEGMVEPAVDEESAREFAEDAEVIGITILRHSGLAEDAPPAEEAGAGTGAEAKADATSTSDPQAGEQPAA